MRTLYPSIAPYKKHNLPVDDIHTLYLEESGNPEGIPVLFVHGGPGGGTSEQSRRFFNPEKYRIILFDQRGCGRSAPHACLEHNTTAHLLADIETIRAHLDIEQWLLFGGSWGATLALLYAQRHPQQVCGLILRGIFLARQQDLMWLYQQGANAVFPDYWQDFSQAIPADERHDLISAYHKRLNSSNEIERMGAARAWADWETRCSTLLPQEGASHNAAALAISRIETHFFINQCFMEENQILDQVHLITHLPTILVHGRYDMICPLNQALSLHQALPQSELHIVRTAGHSAFEEGIIDNLIKATDQFAQTEA